MVLHFTRTLPPSKRPPRGKLPWKKIGDWIREEGGSYHFGAATCAKKWEEIQTMKMV